MSDEIDDVDDAIERYLVENRPLAEVVHLPVGPTLRTGHSKRRAG